MAEDDLWVQPADELSGEEVFTEPVVQKTQVPLKSTNPPGLYRAALKKIVLKKVADSEVSSLTAHMKHDALLPPLATTNTDRNSSPYQSLYPDLYLNRQSQPKQLRAAPIIDDDLWGDNYQQSFVAETPATSEELGDSKQETPTPSHELDHNQKARTAETNLDPGPEDDLWALSHDLQTLDEDEQLVDEQRDNEWLLSQENDAYIAPDDSLLSDSGSITDLFQNFSDESSMRDFQNTVEVSTLLNGFEFIDIESELAELERAEEELARATQQAEIERMPGAESRRGAGQAPGWMGSSSLLYVDWRNEENAEHEALKRLGYANLRISEATRAFILQSARACRLSLRQERQLTTQLANAHHRLNELPDQEDYGAQQDEISAEIAELERILTYNFQWVAVKKAPHFLGHGIELDDLIQYGLLGVVAGIQHFDTKKNTRLLVAVNWWVFQTLSRAVLEYRSLIRLPVHVCETLISVKKHRAGLETTLGRSPTYEELADAVQLTAKRLKELLNLPKIVSLESYTKLEDAHDGYSFQPVEEALVVVEDPEGTDSELSIKQEVNVMLSCLSPREREIIELRYDLAHEHGEIRTLDEIGKSMHITRERVRQIEDKAFKKIRDQQGSYLKDAQNQRTSQKTEVKVPSQTFSPGFEKLRRKYAGLERGGDSENRRSPPDTVTEKKQKVDDQNTWVQRKVERIRKNLGI